jgi:hypothetical protein
MTEPALYVIASAAKQSQPLGYGKAGESAQAAVYDSRIIPKPEIQNPRYPIRRRTLEITIAAPVRRL